MNEAKSLFILKVTELLNEHLSLKINTELASEYMNLKDRVEQVEVKYFSTENNSVYKSTNLDEWFELNVSQPIQAQVESFEDCGSGWTMLRLSLIHISEPTRPY